MKQRYHNSLEEVSTMNTNQLRDHFLVENLMDGNGFNFLYSHYERLVIGGLTASETPIKLPNYDNLKSEYFMERRELGIINTGANGSVLVDVNIW